MPFFFLGYYMKGKNLYLPDKYTPLCIVFLIAILAILFFFPHRLDLSYAFPYKSIYGLAIRMCALTVAIPMSIAFINVCYKTPWIARQGRMSMQYYIYHALIVPPLMAIVNKWNLPMSFITAVVIIMGIAIGIGLVLNIPYIKMLTNPSSFFVKNKNMAN